MLAVAIVIALAVMNWYGVRTADQRFRNEQIARRELSSLAIRLCDAETGQRGFLLVDDESYLEPYNNATVKIPQLLSELHQSMGNDPVQAENLEQLRRAASAKLSELAETLALRRSGDLEGALVIVRSNRGKAFMDEIRDITDRMFARQQVILDNRYHEAENRALQSFAITAFASVLLFGIIAIVNLRFKRERDRALAASHAKSTFLANMSHELRTPLNAIIGYSEMLQEELATGAQPSGIAPDLEKIRTAGGHLLELINSVLDLSKVEAGKMDLFLESFAVRGLIEEVAGILLPLAEKNGNQLIMHYEGELGSMHSDVSKVRQTVSNLISNACKFTHNGKIEVSVSKDNIEGRDWISFEVRDTGIGMSAEEVARIFNPFTQADASTTRKYGGTGLGLALSRRFARMMGGDIEVESQKGAGSSFRLRIPRSISTPSRQEATLPEPVSGFPGERGSEDLVLVIDDDPAVLEMLRRTLERHGFKVEGAQSGEEGLRLARAMHPNAITLDIMMPGLDGWSVLAQLKSDRALASIPVVVVTIVDNKNLGYTLGAADYLTKPIDRERLTQVLSRYRRGNAPLDALIVEDDPESRDVLRRFLENDGWKVRQAENGRVALQRLGEQKPSIILLDLMMPEMDGFEVVAHLKENPDLRGIPVIVVTAKDLTEEDHARLNGQVSRVLQKGAYSREELLEEVSRVVVKRIRNGKDDGQGD